MFAILLTPDYAPFTIAFVVMIGIGLIEAIGLGIGQLGVDGDLGDIEGGTVLDWLGLGSGLPVLIWLTSLLACFTLAGIAIQQGMSAIFGAPLHWAAASAGALVIGGLLNIFAARGLARIMPGYETTAISTDDLIMRRGTILEGAARRGHPARARVVDQHRQAHYIMVEPHDDADVIAQGETALLVRRVGSTFYASPDEHATLRSI